jgi:hypothetical protein
MKTCYAGTTTGKPCGKPSVHAIYNPQGELRFYCVAHYDKIMADMRKEWHGGFPGWRMDAIQKMRKLNPGLL